MKIIDTKEYVSALRDLTEQGHEVNMLISGNSMSPFLIHERDYIYFSKPDRPLKKGDIVFYERDNGEFIMHRICKVHIMKIRAIADESEGRGKLNRSIDPNVHDRLDKSGGTVGSNVTTSREVRTYDIIGDAQRVIERGIREDQIFARIDHVKRKDRDIYPGDFWWDFFEKVWIRIIPLRPLLRRGYSLIAKMKAH